VPRDKEELRNASPLTETKV